MKTIFLSIYDGDAEKNILRSQVLPRLKASGHRIVILIRGEGRIEYYRKEYQEGNVIVEPLPNANTRLEKLWYHISRNSIPTRSVYVRNVRDLAGHKKLWRFCLERCLSYLAHLRVWREFLRALYALVGEDYIPDLFEKYRPDLVYAQNMFSPEDCRILLSARRRKIKTVTTAKSWDVLTTKAFTRVKGDRFLVFNEFNRAEAVQLGDYPAKRVVVTGFPQFDIYRDASLLRPREEFLASLGFPSDARYAFYSVPGDWKLPYTRDILMELDRRLGAGGFPPHVRLYVEIHPKYSDPSEAAAFTHIRLHRPGTYFSEKGEFSLDAGVHGAREWTFTKDDIAHLLNVIHHSDLVICTDSTLSLDAAAIDRPAVLVAYDGDAKLPYKRSIAFIYEREHYQNVLRTGGVFRVSSHDELRDAICTYIEHPEHLRKEREELKARLLYASDGKAGERVANAVLELLES